MQQIRNIEIKNFKSIRHQTIEDCRRINVFIGYPNVGKSNILEALGLFSVVLLSKGEGFKLNEICRVKHFSELYFNQNYRSPSLITLNQRFQLDLSLENNTNMLELKCGELNLMATNIQKDFDVYWKFRIEQQDMFINEQQSSNILTSENPNFIIAYNSIKRYSYINDSIVSNRKSFPLSIPYGDNLLEVLQREAELRRNLSKILGEYGLKLLLDIGSGSIMLIREIDSSSVLQIPYHQIADTLKRLIFYKAAIATNQNSVLLFEEPEAHMFPPYISKFTNDLISDKNNNQYFIGTHSPFVLNDFMEDMEKEDLSIYVVGLKDGATVIRRLTDEEITEVYQYGVDLFFNLEDYLKDAVS